MPSLAHHQTTTSSQDLKEWCRRGEDIEEYLDIVFKEVANTFIILSSRFSQFDDETGSVIVNMNALYAEANAVASDYVDLFDTYVCLQSGARWPYGLHRYKAHSCLITAYSIMAVGLGAEPEHDLEKVVLKAWSGILTVS